MSALLDLPVLAAHHLVAGLVSTLTPMLGGAAAVAAIVAVTLAVRLLLLPLSRSVARTTKARAALAPEIAAVRKKYRHDPVRAQRETAQLLRGHGISPFAGALPGLAQVPFFWVMYRLFASASVAGHANLLLTHTVFGVPLAGRLVAAGGVAHAGLLGPYILVYAAVLLLLLGVAWWSGRLARRTLGDDTPPAVRRVAPLLPYTTVVVAAFVPLAAAVYLLVSTTWTAIERTALHPYAARPVRP